MTEIAAQPPQQKSAAHNTVFVVLFAISFCHLLNDMMQSLLPAIYPSLKTALHLNFAQIGFITLSFQAVASLLQPVIGMAADKRPMPWSLPSGMVATLLGLLTLSLATSYPMVICVGDADRFRLGGVSS